MAVARRLVVNPANTAQRMILWSTGYIQPIGGAPTPSGYPTWYNNPVGEPAMALAITNWTTGAGYVLDFFGGVHAFGGATAPGTFPPSSNPFAYYIDFTMNPAGNGQGHALTIDGALAAIGTATPITTGLALSQTGRRVVSSWVGPTYILDGRGGIHGFGGAPTATGEAYWKSQDIARALAVTDFATGRGYVMDGYGGIHTVNGTEAAPGGPYWPGWDTATDLVVIDSDPLTLVVLDALGGTHEWTVSRRPRATAGLTGAPDDPTTVTTRPTLGFDFTDIDGDSMQSATVLLFRQADTQQPSWVNEVQTLTRTGSPTGGTFKVRLEDSVTGTISGAATTTAATVQTAIRTLPGCGSATVTGPNGGPWVVTHAGTRERSWQPKFQIEANALTGGTNPNVTVTRTTQGTDPTAKTDVLLWKSEITDPTVRAVDVPFDLDNATYRMLVQVTDSSGLVSGWRKQDFTMNVTRPTAPALTAVDQGGVQGIAIGVTLSSPPAGSLLDVEFADDYNPANPNGATWQHVRGTVQITTGTGGTSSRKRGADLGMNVYDPNSTVLLQSAALSLQWIRWAEERNWYANDAAWIAAIQAQLNLVRGVTGPDGLPMRAIVGMLGVPSSLNSNAGAAHGASVGSQHGTLSASVTNVAAPPASITLTGVTGTFPYMGKLRSAAGQVIGYDRMAVSGTSVTFTSLYAVSGSGSIASGANITSYYDATPTTNHWFPNSQANCDAYANMAAQLAAILDPSRDMIELWNEPNIESFNGGMRQDKAGSLYQSEYDFGRMLVTLIRKIRQVAPTLKIIVGSLAANGDDYNPYPGANEFSMANYWARTLQAWPSLLTTDRADFVGIHPYNISGGVTAGFDDARSDDAGMYLFRDVDPDGVATPGATYRTSSPKTNKGWNGHVQAMLLRNVHAFASGGTAPNLLVTEAGAFGAQVGESASVAAIYPEDWQADHTKEELQVIFGRIDAGIYSKPALLHTIEENTTLGVNDPYRYYGVTREDNSWRAAALVVLVRANELLVTGGGGGGGGTAIVDYEAPFGVPRYYRAFVYTPDPYLASVSSGVVSATLTKGTWILSVPGNALLQLAVEVVPPFKLTTPTVTFAAQPAGGRNAVVVRDGGLKGAQGTITLRTRDSFAYELLFAVLDVGQTLLLRDPYGRAWYVQVAGEVEWDQLHSSLRDPRTPELPVGFVHEVAVPIIQTDRPVEGTADLDVTLLG